ncbi:hypothetical protein JCM10213_006613 [Rhodosporidiobolus nylandii]
MPPRRKAAQAAADTHEDPPSTTRSSRRSSAASTSTAKQQPARVARSTRTSRARVSEASTVDEDEEEDEQQDSPAEDDDSDDEPVRPARRSTASASRRPQARSARPPISSASTASTGSTSTRASVSAASRARRSARLSAASEVSTATTAEDEAEEGEQESEEEEEKQESEDEDEEEKVKPRSRRAPPSRRQSKKAKFEQEEQAVAPPSPAPSGASLAEHSEEEEEEQSEEEELSEEEPAPVKQDKGKARRVSHLPTPQPESGAEDEEQEEQSEAETEVAGPSPDAVEQEEEGTPPPVTPAKSRAKGKGKARVVESSDDEDEETAAGGEEEKLLTPSAGQPLPAVGVAPRSPSPTPAPASPAPAAVAAPAPPPPPAQSTALTASSLASIARQAALEHAAEAATRAKELEGKPRLVIHQLVLENFKSYGGRGVIGPFHKSFSSIVGPNGSGKSNTIDALLFVFGFRATKMRQGKFSELIHNSGPAPSAAGAEEVEQGSEEEDFEAEESESEEEVGRKKGRGKGKGRKAPRKKASSGVRYSGGPDFATVEVWFREIIDLPGGRDEFSVVPGSQLIVARTVKRDNSTRYTINGKTTTPGEVKQLLLGRGIDLTHNRFLILQGEVESIAQMPPKGRTEHEEGLLEYLEDIIGTASYKPQIEEAVAEVEKLGDERAVVMNRVKLVEKEKGALETRKKSADAFLRDQLQLVAFQSQLYQRHAHQAQADKALYEEQLGVAKTELDAEMERQKADREVYEEGVRQVKETEAGLKEIETAAAALGKELATFEKAKVQLTVQKKAADTKYAKLKKTLEEDKHGRSAAEGAIRDHGDTLDKLVESKEALKAELEEEQVTLNELMASLKDKVAPLNKEIEDNQRQLAPWKEQIESKQNEHKIASQQLADVRSKATQAEADIARVEQEMEDLAALQKTKIGEMRELRKRQKEVAAGLEDARQRVAQQKSVEAKHRAAVNAAREKTTEAKASQSASQSKGAVLTAVQKLKDQGRLPGFHGRLGDLGRIDDAYDIAISTAAAGGLESLVVDTRETAEAIFDHLRKHNIGRASCIALDRFPANVDLALIQTPRGTERLFDLVTPKDKVYAPVFRHVLKNTLVARDWDTAHAVSTGKVDGSRWRVVTTDGNIAEASGAAQVGGSRPLRGKMGSRIAADEVTPKQLAKLEQEEKDAMVKLEEFAEGLKEVEAELKALVKEMSEIEASIPKVEMDLEANKKDAEEKVALLEELQSQSEPDAADVKRAAQLEKDISRLEGDIEALRTKASKYEDAIAALEDKIREVGGIKFRTAEAKVSDLQDQIRLSDGRLVKAKTEKAKAEKDLVKFGKSIETNTVKCEELEEEIGELKQQLAEKEAEAEPVRKTVEEAQARVEEGREELANLKSELEEQEEAIIEFRKAEAHLKGVFNDVDRKLKETTRIFEHWTGKIGELQMPEFELLEDDESDHEGDAAEDAEPRQKAPRVEEVLRVLDPEEIEQVDVKRLKADIALLEERLEKNTADLAVLQEYRRREEEFRKRGEEFEGVSREWDAAKNQVTELRNERLVKFMKGFGVISNKLKEMYQMITLGGNAELELYDSADPFSEGILFSVMPPKKSWKNISNLSGGEKTLSSLALVFALHVYKPTPLYFMDEIDAALDFRNVSIVANYIKDRTKNAQFIIISLRNNMFELSSRLVGIYKVANQTRSVAIDNKELSEIPDDEENGTIEEEAEEEPEQVQAPEQSGEEEEAGADEEEEEAEEEEEE